MPDFPKLVRESIEKTAPVVYNVQTCGEMWGKVGNYSNNRSNFGAEVARTRLNGEQRSCFLANTSTTWTTRDDSRFRRAFAKSLATAW